MSFDFRSLFSLRIEERRYHRERLNFLLMPSHPAIRLIAGSTRSAVGSIHLQCHVKPGASKQREGVVSVSESLIEVCVSAQPKHGEANKAVRDLFSDVEFSERFARPSADFTRSSNARSPTWKSLGV